MRNVATRVFMVIIADETHGVTDRASLQEHYNNKNQRDIKN